MASTAARVSSGMLVCSMTRGSARYACQEAASDWRRGRSPNSPRRQVGGAPPGRTNGPSGTTVDFALYDLPASQAASARLRVIKPEKTSGMTKKYLQLNTEM